MLTVKKIKELRSVEHSAAPNGTGKEFFNWLDVLLLDMTFKNKNVLRLDDFPVGDAGVIVSKLNKKGFNATLRSEDGNLAGIIIKIPE
jgi:hypothetical protein